MASLHDIDEFLAKELKITEIPDYQGAMNGLQLENSGEVTKVAAAVDASLPVFRKAIAENADLLVVHHGMFWQGAQRITGGIYQKLKIAMDAGMAVYSAHIPLDVHPVIGNNRLLADSLGMANAEPFFDWKGIKLGLKQGLDLTLEELRERLVRSVNDKVHVCPGGSEKVGMVGVITGGAGSEVAAMVEEGIQTFITGEGPHWSYPLAEELGVNLLYGGHYATETFGVKKLVEIISEKFETTSVFIDHPTGL